MNTGTYRIEIAVHRRGHDMILNHDALSFEVHDDIDAVSKASGMYIGPWLGAVRPLIVWKSEYASPLQGTL